MRPPGTCSTCRWWGAEGRTALRSDMAECRAGPPCGMAHSPDPELPYIQVPVPIWPVTRSSDWCGQHQAKPEVRAMEAARNAWLQTEAQRAFVAEDQKPS